VYLSLSGKTNPVNPASRNLLEDPHRQRGLLGGHGRPQFVSDFPTAFNIESSDSTGSRHRVYKCTESGFNFYRRGYRIAKLFRQDFKLGLPLCRDSDARREVVRNPLRKYLLGCRTYSPHVQLAQQANQQNVQHIAGARLRIWPGAGVQLLGNLFIQIQATNRRRCPQPHCGESSNRWLHQIHGARSCCPQIDINGLPCTGSILDSEFQSNHINFSMFNGLPFNRKVKSSNSERERVLKQCQPRCAFA
jgi:hypothetical protein